MVYYFKLIFIVSTKMSPDLRCDRQVDDIPSTGEFITLHCDHVHMIQHKYSGNET